MMGNWTKISLMKMDLEMSMVEEKMTMKKTTKNMLIMKILNLKRKNRKMKT